jgi:predicted RNA-binding protein with PIN domain
LHDALRRFSDGTGEEVVLVLDGSVSGLQEGTSGRLTIVASPTRRRNAADDEIVRLVGEEPAPGRLRVVTSDASLAERVRRLGASVEGAGTFRRRISA